ncbi:MAG: protein-glutamate O-methyltransferase CheR [Bacteroidia bacterium]|jgi:chemotaxis protein methyltransferase CheR|nr:protein-glutamate O-methyltransferase CheR [Bacteroidia bacterium]
MLLDQNELNELTLLIKKQFGLDLSDYAKSSLQRRFHHLCVLNGLTSKLQLFEFIKKQSSKNSLVEKITVSTTEMFRDPSFWTFLREDILKTLGEKEHVTIWHSACSSGEEIVSMAILLQETGLADKTKLLGTDINACLLKKAEKATYAERKLILYKNNYSKASGKENFDAYFELDEQKQFTFKEDLLKNTGFSVFDLVHNQSTMKFDMILCRNVLIYFNADLQSRVLQKLCNCLNPGGFLALGKNESILKSKPYSRLIPYQPVENIYRVY